MRFPTLSHNRVMKERDKIFLDARLGTLAEEYHLVSANRRVTKKDVKAYQANFEAGVRNHASEPPERLPGVPRVPLSSDRERVSRSVEGAISQRVSTREFSSEPLSEKRLSTLLHLGNGVRQVLKRDDTVRYQRNCPSSGNLGSVEVYPIVMNVEGVRPGIYHFDSLNNELGRLHEGQFRTWLRDEVLWQAELSAAAVALVLTCRFGHLARKYAIRSYRLGLLDAGHVSENIHLVATGLDLHVCATAGFVDSTLNKTLGLDGLDAASILILFVGEVLPPRPSQDGPG